MVHSFTCLDSFFVLDTESGSLFCVDKTVYDIIGKLSSVKTGEVLPFLQSISPSDLNYNADDAVDNLEFEEAKREIAGLISEGALFTADQAITPPVYNGVIKSMCLNISHACNLRCGYCFAGGGSYSGSEVNMDICTAKAAVDFLIQKSGDRRILEIDFFGGEPLLNLKVVKDTVEYARQKERETGKKFRFTITTNGMALSGDAIDFFNREMHNVVISIDGRREVHNLVRKTRSGDGSFDEALKNAQEFRKTRGDKLYYIRGTFTAQSKDFAADALFLADQGFDQISLEPVVLPSSHPLALKDEDLQTLKNQYEVLAREYIKRRKGDKWFSFFHFMIDLSGGPCLKKRITGCGAGCEYVAVSPSGNIYPCHRFDGKNDYIIGNVKTGKFSPEIPKKFAASSLPTKKECADCFCKYFCSGGCAANSIEYGGGIDECYRFSCELMRKRTECALAIYAKERENSDADGK